MMCYRRDACRRGKLKYVTSSHGKAPEISDAHEARCAAGRRRPAVPRIMLTGAPGAGKTTLACRIAAELQASGIVVAGFTSRELRERGERVGFQVEAIGGGSAVMAHVGFTEGPQVGRYRVDVPAFERIALSAMERATRADGVAVIDELGPMELYSRAFVHAVQHLFEQDVPVMATVHARAHPVTDALKHRPGIEQLTVTHAAQKELLAYVTSRLVGTPGGGAVLSEG
jgi:nucleoside-triphosphatase